MSFEILLPFGLESLSRAPASVWQWYDLGTGGTERRFCDTPFAFRVGVGLESSENMEKIRDEAPVHSTAV